MCFLVNSNQWEGSAPRLLRGDRNHGFSAGTGFLKGVEGERERERETEMTAREIFHWPVAESVRGLLKNSASLFTNGSRKNGNGTGIEWGSSGLFFFSDFCFSAFFLLFFLPDFSEMIL